MRPTGGVSVQVDGQRRWIHYAATTDERRARLHLACDSLKVSSKRHGPQDHLLIVYSRITRAPSRSRYVEALRPHVHHAVKVAQQYIRAGRHDCTFTKLQ